MFENIAPAPTTKPGSTGKPTGSPTPPKPPPQDPNTLQCKSTELHSRLTCSLCYVHSKLPDNHSNTL